MKVNLISDCHLNFGDLTLPGGDILVMAGDIIEAGKLRIADNDKRDTFIADRFRRFFKEEMPKYREVVYVCGNHEHYSNKYHDTHDRIRRELPANVNFLENSWVKIDDVYFWGATLWTDMNKGDPITVHHLKQYMNDYAGSIKMGEKITTMYGSYYTSKFNPEYAKSLFHETVANLKKFLEEHPEDKVVVVTHHAPSDMSVDEYFKREFHMNGGYRSNLENFILDHPNIKVWCHGHMHDPSDYMIGDTRVLANPRGYVGYESRVNEFDPAFYFEV